MTPEDARLIVILATATVTMLWFAARLIHARHRTTHRANQIQIAGDNSTQIQSGRDITIGKPIYFGSMIAQLQASSNGFDIKPKPPEPIEIPECGAQPDRHGADERCTLFKGHPGQLHEYRHKTWPPTGPPTRRWWTTPDGETIG